MLWSSEHLFQPCIANAEIQTEVGPLEPFLLSLLSLNGKFGDCDSREKLAPTQESFVAGVSATETAATYRSGCLRNGKLPWNQTSVARRDPSVKPALLTESRLVYGEKKGKMPYDDELKLVEQRAEPN